MKKRLFLCFLFFPLFIYSQTNSRFEGKVAVWITANENMKGLIESYISRELRSLGDIIITENNPDWIISIVAMETQNVAGYKTGIVFSVVILSPFNVSDYSYKISPKEEEIIKSITKDVFYYIGHWLKIGGPNDLKKMCTELVANFDTEYVKPIRDYWIKINDLFDDN